MHTLGKVDFDSIIILDFGERLKSVLTSFVFSDVPSDKVKFLFIKNTDGSNSAYLTFDNNTSAATSVASKSI